MKIRFHKILADGRCVRYETKPEDKEEVIDLNIIVTRDTRSKSGRN